MQKIILTTLLIFSLAGICQSSVIDDYYKTKHIGIDKVKLVSNYLNEAIEVDIVISRDSQGRNIVFGVANSPPNNVISSIRINKSTKIDFPEKVFSDLANISIEGPFYLKANKDALFLTLKGGDGAVSYAVVFKVQNNKVVSRFVSYMGPDGKNIKEISDY